VQVGLPDDELFRRVRVHRGVYGKWEDTAPKGHTLFHLTPAQFFQGQLPIGRGQDAYVSEDFHHVGAVEAFMNPDDLLAHANAHYAERAGYFYVLQIDTSALTDISENGGEEAYSMDDGDEHGGARCVSIKGVVNAEASQRIYVAARERETHRAGKFTDVSPPTGRQMPKIPKKE
jgi:zinc finger HIT domain-containing protein 1